MTVRGLIFDFDGLILDTETPSLHSWLEVYAEHGCEFPFELWAEVLGTSGAGFDCHGHLEARIGRTLDRETLRLARRGRTDALIAAAAVLPGVVEYLDAAEALGLRLAVASSSPRTWVEGHLGRLGLLDRFHALTSAEDVPRVKPDPALYRLALERLGLRPEEAVALEDSPHGITAARAAGILCIVVPNSITERLRIDHADHRLASLSELALPALLDELSGLRQQVPRWRVTCDEAGPRRGRSLTPDT